MPVRSFFTKNMSYSASDYIGRSGELFYDSTDGILRLSDGDTVGGIQVSVGNTFIISGLSDLPTPVNNIITLNNNTEYVIRGVVDIGNNKIICGTNQVFRGLSTEISVLSGNVENDALITTNSTIIAESLTFKNTGTNSQVFNANSFSSADIFTFKDVNIVASVKAGTISNYRNSLFLLHAHISCDDGWTFDGNLRSVVFDTTATVNNNTSGYIFCDLTSTANVASRVRAVFSNFTAGSATIMFKFDPATIIPVEGFQLINCQFSGAGTYVDGLTQANNQTWWVLNGNLRDTLAFAHVFSDEAANTTISSSGVWYKAIANTSVHMEHIERFNHTENRLTYTGAKDRSFIINGKCSVTGTVGNTIRVGVAVNANTQTGVIVYSKVTMPAAGRFEVVPLISHARLTTNDFVEIWVYNESAAQNINISDLSLIVSEIGV